MTTSNECPMSVEDLGSVCLSALRPTLSDPKFAHHLAKASVERWVAFELAYLLDGRLPEGWRCLVERGGSEGLGPVDLLIVPKSATVGLKRFRVRDGPWPENAVVIELKAAHLGDGESGYRDALLDDLTERPQRAARAGRPCASWLGMLITTDGLGPDATARQRETANGRGESVERRSFRLTSPLFCMSHATAQVEHGEWHGRAWVDAVGKAELPGPARENILVPPPQTEEVDAIWKYSESGRDGAFHGYEHAKVHLGYDAGDLANARLEEYERCGEWRGTYEELRVCLFFQFRCWHHWNAAPDGEDFRSIQSLMDSIRRVPVALVEEQVHS